MQVGEVSRQSLTLGASILLLTIGCSNPPPEPTTCVLAGHSYTTSGGGTFAESYLYNDKGQVISIVSNDGTTPFTGNYTYGTNGNLLSATFSDGSSQTFTFDSNNRMIQRMSLPGGQSLELTYNTDGQNTGRTFTDPGCGTCGYTITYVYPNATTHNYESQTMVNIAGTVATTYTYDAHPNPFKPVLYSSTGTDNNVIQEVMTDGGPPQTTTYTYTYNNVGYPLTRVSSAGSTEGFSYNCH